MSSVQCCLLFWIVHSLLTTPVSLTIINYLACIQMIIHNPVQQSIHSKNTTNTSIEKKPSQSYIHVMLYWWINVREILSSHILLQTMFYPKTNRQPTKKANTSPQKSDIHTKYNVKKQKNSKWAALIQWKYMWTEIIQNSTDPMNIYVDWDYPEQHWSNENLCGLKLSRKINSSFPNVASAVLYSE